MQPAATLLQQRPAPVQAKGPPGHGPDQVTERSRQRHHDVRRKVRRHTRPEEIHVLSGEGTRGERSGVDHHELARSRKDRVDRHQQEHGVDAVITDQRRERARDAGDRHAAEATRAA